MKFKRDKIAPTKYGKGTTVYLDGDELAHAIHSYLYARDVVIDGASTVTISTTDGAYGRCHGARVYVDPSGRVIHEGNAVKGPDEAEPRNNAHNAQRYREALEAIAKYASNLEAATDYAKEILEGKNPEPWWV